MGAAEEQAVEGHVAGCAPCQGRLEQLSWGKATRPGSPAGPERGREDRPLPAGVPERARRRETEADRHPTPTPSAAGAPAPMTDRRAAAPDPADGPESPATGCHLTTDLTPTPPAVPARPGAEPTPPAVFGRYQVR